MIEHSNANLIFRDADRTSNRTFRATGVAEHWWSQGVEELSVGESAEPIVMDADRQKLELDITQEFEIADSNGMVIVQGVNGYFLLMIDIPKEKLSRPSFHLSGKAFHPRCLVRAIEDWLREYE